MNDPLEEHVLWCGETAPISAARSLFVSLMVQPILSLFLFAQLLSDNAVVLETLNPRTISMNFWQFEFQNRQNFIGTVPRLKGFTHFPMPVADESQCAQFVLCRVNDDIE